MFLTVRMIFAAVAGIVFLWFAVRSIDVFFQRRRWTSVYSRIGKVTAQYSLVLLVLIALIPASAIERRVIFVPLTEPMTGWEDELRFGEVKDVFIPLASGNKLHGWYLEPKRTSDRKPDYYILYFHGNGGNLTYYVNELKGMVKYLNAAVFSIDYSGYGQSDGEPSEYQLYRDGYAAMKKFQELSGRKPGEIVVVGMSLGGGVASQIALKMQQNGTPVKALILECTFSSIPRMATELLPLLPANWLLTTRFDTNTRLREYNGPLLISHGDADRVVSYKHAILNDEAARTVVSRNGDYRFITIPDGMHAGYFNKSYFLKVKQFLDETT